MAHIELRDVAHAYETGAREQSWALRPMTLTWNDGGAFALLGPSGCGKTTLLNIISGLIKPTVGQVLFDGRDVTTLAPEQRNIAQVFQFPVIYDTMSVYDNLAFPLRNRRWQESQVRTRVQEIAEILELSAVLQRRAKGLSADAKQKISLGRGLVRPDVAAVLFDEPLTVIDPHVKWLLRRKLKQIHEQLQLTLIYVTHDQTEALTFADQVLVMTQGEVVQQGTPQALFESPAHRFVGHFIGSPGMNFIPCEWVDAPRIGGVSLATASATTPPSPARIEIGIRPEHIELRHTPSANCLPVTIEAVHDHGTHLMIDARAGSNALWVKMRDTHLRPQLGATFAYFPADRCALYADERRIP